MAGQNHGSCRVGVGVLETEHLKRPIALDLPWAALVRHADNGALEVNRVLAEGKRGRHTSADNDDVAVGKNTPCVAHAGHFDVAFDIATIACAIVVVLVGVGVGESRRRSKRRG